MIKEFLKDYEYYENVDLRKYNTYKVSSIAKILIFPKNEKELVSLLKYLRENNLKYLLLGNGSNVILASDSYEIVIKLDRLDKVDIKDNIIIAGPGVSLIKLATLACEHDLSGLEFAYGIPGLIGASIAMNAGAYNEDLGFITKEIKVIDENFNIITLKHDELNFSYRNSLLKENRNLICLEATIELKNGNKNAIKALMEDRKQRRLATQPLDLPSAGSVFRNPKDLYAGAIIENLGLKGYNINGIEVSEKHANFIVNKGNGTGSDIVKLIDIIKNKVKEEYDIDLILEQEIKR